MSDEGKEKLKVRLTENGIAIGSKEQGFVELRLTKTGVMYGTLDSDSESSVELEITPKGVVVFNPKGKTDFQELTLTKDGLILGAPGNC